MASTGSSDVENEEDNNDHNLSPKKVGRAAEYPEFAIIWSYLENFCELLRFPELTLDGLEDAFNSHSPRNENCRQLEYLHKKLLIRLHKNFRPEKWEKALLKVAKEQNMLSSWDLENFGYNQLKVCTKLELFKMLLESQFDNNSKLKTAVNKNYEADELRLQPFGYDMDGLLYWFHMDEVGGVRLYSTEEDEVENESWKLLAGDLEELEAVVDFLILKSETNPKDIVLAKKEEERKKQEENIKASSKKKKKSKKAAVTEELDDDNPCARCYSNVHPDSILLCDKCDAAYHTACLRPPLLTVPQGDWFCPFCQQLVLLERLKEKRTRLVARQRLRARQEKRLTKSGMNLSNILQGPGSDEEQIDTIRRSGRARKTVDYTFRDFDEEIMDAVETDKKRLKLDPEMNGHPTGKPAFAVERFYKSAKPESAIGRRRSRRLKDLDSGSESDSKVSEYEYDGSTDEDLPKPPERHVYLRRHIIEDDEEEDEDEESKTKTNGECETDEEKEKLESGKNVENESEENNGKSEIKDSEDDKKDDSLNNSQESTKDNNTDDTSSEKSGPTYTHPSSNETSDTKEEDKDEDKEKKVDKDDLSVPKRKPPPLERVSSPKIDPLLDSLGFGALASFSNNDKYPSRPQSYGSLRSPSQDLRSPSSRSDTGFSSTVSPPSSTYPNVGNDSRYANYPNQSSTYGNYFGYNQRDYTSVPGMDCYPQSTQASRQPFGLPGTRFTGYAPPGISKRETLSFTQTPLSPSFSQPPSYPSSISGYPALYPGNDMTSRPGYYPSNSQGYGRTNKSPYGQPPPNYFSEEPFPPAMFYGNPSSTTQQGGVSSWPTPTSGSSAYFPQTGLGHNRTGL